jgi:hypothetical protein
MFRAVLCGCIAVTLVSSSAASAQRAPARRPVPPPARPAPARPAPTPAPPRANPADRSNNDRPDSGPPRPEGFKPITLETARKETARLRATIEKLGERIKARKAEKAAAAGGTGAAAADDGQAAKSEPAAQKASADTAKEATPSKSAVEEKKPTLATVERENKTLRRQVDKLLLEVAALEETIPARGAGLPPYDPHVIDSPTNADFCPQKTMEQLEDTMRFTGVPVGESEDQIAYEWTIYLTNDKRTKHVGHRVWALMKDGISTNTMEAAPGIVKDGPPPKAP